MFRYVLETSSMLIDAILLDFRTPQLLPEFNANGDILEQAQHSEQDATLSLRGNPCTRPCMRHSNHVLSSQRMIGSQFEY
jgi:hypothetical protein